MSDYVTLLGAEDVQRAANQMQGAADQMQGAANQIDESLRQHQQFMDDWLARFESAIGSVR